MRFNFLFFIPAQQWPDQLDNLAGGGYIIPEEYQATKKAFWDGM